MASAVISYQCARERHHQPLRSPSHLLWATVTVGKLCEGVREGERKRGRSQRCLWLAVNVCPPSFRMAWDSLCSGDLLCPRIRSTSSRTPGSWSRAGTSLEELRCLLWKHPPPQGTWMKSGQTFTWETCKREGRVEGVNVTLSSYPISPSPSQVFHSVESPSVEQCWTVHRML